MLCCYGPAPAGAEETVANEILEAKKEDAPQQTEPEVSERTDQSDSEREKSLADTIDEWLTPKPDSPPQLDSREPLQEQSGEQVGVKKAPSLVDKIEDFVTPSPMPVPVPNEEEAIEQNEPEQKFIKVRVPRGVPAGSVMQVEIPGENRAIAVTVPAEVDSFHVAYTPLKKMPKTPETAPRSAPKAKAKTPPTITPTMVPPSQKLLLVRVPPGTQPGATLHVSVPDEPGRILAAQVPPGNVPEFHVAYESRAPKEASTAGMLPPANAYQSPSDKSAFEPLDTSDASYGGYDF